MKEINICFTISVNFKKKICYSDWQVKHTKQKKNQEKKNCRLTQIFSSLILKLGQSKCSFLRKSNIKLIEKECAAYLFGEQNTL
jgi:hypothetical protein